MEELKSSKIGRNLRKIRKKARLSSEDIAKKIGISPKTVYNYETGKSRKIPQWVVEQYSDICLPLIDQHTEGHSTPLTPFQADNLGELVKTHEIDEELGEPFYAPAEPGPMIPIISMVAAGRMEFTDQGWGAGSSDEWLSRPHGFLDDTAYACRVEGDSMLPLLKPGMLIIASPNIPLNDIASGDLVVVKTQDMKVSVKELFKSGKMITLTSWNKDHPDIRLTEKDLIFIHKVVWFRTRK